MLPWQGLKSGLVVDVQKLEFGDPGCQPISRSFACLLFSLLVNRIWGVW